MRKMTPEEFETFLDRLRPMQKDVLRVLGEEGACNSEIAYELKYSVHTVNRAVQDMLRMAGVSDRIHLALLYRDHKDIFLTRPCNYRRRRIPRIRETNVNKLLTKSS